MPPKSEARASARASRISCGGFICDDTKLSSNTKQLPPIISRHLWRPQELAALATDGRLRTPSSEEAERG